MNERIRKLAEQQGFTGPNFYISSSELEKFAELVVRECAVIADEPTSQPFSSYGEKIKEYFGVE